MYIIIGLMLAGMLVGYLFRQHNCRNIHQIITGLIWLLLFILGVEVGGNATIIKGMSTIGAEAVVLTLGGITGSVIAAWGLWRTLWFKKKGTQR